jgi:hypothetical protein
VDLLAQIRLKQPNQPCTLFLPDWSAIVLSACDADAKLITAYFDVVVKSLKSIDPDLMQGVTVVKQSDCILKDPSNYWISVINVGRFFPLNTVQEGFDDEKKVGNVIDRLLLVADCIAISPKTVTCVAGDVHAKVALDIVAAYWKDAEIPLPTPVFMVAETTNVKLHDVQDVHATDNTE